MLNTQVVAPEVKMELKTKSRSFSGLNKDYIDTHVAIS